MIVWLVTAALAAVLAIWALNANARAYTRKVELQFPPQGRFIDTELMRIHVREAGPEHGPRMLLIHGASANLLEFWQPLEAEFSPLHRVIAYDRPGLGHSSRARRNAQTLASQARVAAEVLKQTGGPALIVAHSLGAAVALRLALDHPHLVTGLVLVAPASHPSPHKPAWWARASASPLTGPLFNLLIPLLGPMRSAGAVANNFWPQPVPVNYLNDAGVPLVFRPRAFKASACDVVASNKEFAAQQPRYGDLLTPAVIITAEKDKVVSPKRHARALAADLPAAELVIAPDTGHMPHRLRTDLVIAAIRRVNELTTAAAAD